LHNKYDSLSYDTDMFVHACNQNSSIIRQAGLSPNSWKPLMLPSKSYVGYRISQNT